MFVFLNDGKWKIFSFCASVTISLGFQIYVSNTTLSCPDESVTKWALDVYTSRILFKICFVIRFMYIAINYETRTVLTEIKKNNILFICRLANIFHDIWVLDHCGVELILINLFISLYIFSSIEKREP